MKKIISLFIIITLLLGVCHFSKKAYQESKTHDMLVNWPKVDDP